MDFGYGIRVPHYRELLQSGAGVPFVEAIAENFIERGGRPRQVLERVRRDARLALHGVSLSIGSTDELNWTHVDALRDLARAVDADFVSDHLCFGSVGGHYAHDLWPLPYTEEALAHVVERAQRVRDRVGRPLLLENVSSYVEYRASTMPEWEFLRAVAERADIGILLDLNNVIVSAKNHGFSAERYIAALPRNRVQQLHLAGHTDYDGYAIDDHGSEVPEAVWSLFRRSLQRFGAVPAIIEWDERIPSLEQLQREAAKIAELSAEELTDVARSA